MSSASRRHHGNLKRHSHGNHRTIWIFGSWARYKDLPPVTCTSCKGDGFLHIGCHERGKPYRVEIDKDEPCWTCGGKGVIEPRAMNMMGKSLYKFVAEEQPHA
jgi:hypothetical protein